MLFGKSFNKALSEQDRLKQVKEIPLRSLAHLGDAVFELFERERELLASVTVKKMHDQVVSRVNSKEQARLIALLKPNLTEDELDIVRRAGKPLPLKL